METDRTSMRRTQRVAPRLAVNDRPPLEVGQTKHDGAWAIAQPLGGGERYLRYKALGKGLRPAELKEYFPSRWRRIDGVPQPVQNDDFEIGLASYFREALESARMLSMHPGLVMTFDVFFDGPGFGAAYEWIEGESLEAVLIRQTALERDELWPILRQAGDALLHLHELGYLHRDISPGNILIESNGKVRVTDYETISPYPKTRSFRDTVTINPDYAAIELHSKFALYGPETDVYAFAATAYHALTGRRPPPARLRIASPTVPPAFTVRPGISEAASDAVARGLSLRAKDRTPTIAQFLRELGL